MTYSRLGDEFLVHGSAAGTQSDAATTGLADGGFVMVWVSNYGAVRGQRFDASGQRVGAEFPVNATGSQPTQPSVTAMAGGGFVVSWADYNGDGSSDGVLARMFGANGAPIGGDFVVSSVTAGMQLRPVIASLDGGGFVATWVDYSGVGGDTSNSAIKAQMFDAAGARVGGEFLVNTLTAGYQVGSAVTGLADGGFVVTWSHNTGGLAPTTAEHGIRGQRYDANGVAVGAEFLVDQQTAGAQDGSAVTALSDGGFVVVWRDSSAAGGDIKARIYDASGAPVGGEFLVNAVTAGYQAMPSVTALADGGFAVSWADGSGQTGDLSNDGVVVRVFDANGVAAGAEVLVNDTTASYQYDPQISSLAGGGFVVSWLDRSGASGGGDDIRAQLYAPGGTLQDSIAITSGGGGDTAVLTVGENIATVGTVTAEGTRRASYSIVGGADAGRFRIEPTTGALSFREAPDFENPADVGADNAYDVIVRAQAGVARDDQAIRVQVANADDGHVAITSGGGAASTSIRVAENGTAVTVVTAEGTGTPAFSIVGGADAALFRIDPATGALSFRSAPDFEAPADAGRNGVYDVVVRATSGFARDDQAIAVTVEDVTEDAVSIVSHPDPYGNEVAVDENGSAVASVVAEGTGAPAYSIVGGADAALFRVDPQTGALSFVQTPDYERPGDADGDNLYVVTVRAMVGTAHDDAVIGVRVRDVAEGMIGSEGNDVLVGTALADIIAGLGGDDRIDGGAGDDEIRGGTGRNELLGGEGRDLIVSEGRGDLIDGGAGDDVVQVSDVPAAIYGGEGYDTLRFVMDAREWANGPAVIDGFERVDGVIEGSADPDWVDMRGNPVAGTIRFSGGDGGDRFFGGRQDDTVFGDGGDDQLLGGEGNDVLDGGAGNDLIDGGAGDDELVGGPGRDSLYGGDGNDRIRGAFENEVLGGAGDDDVRAFNPLARIDGGEGFDRLFLEIDASTRPPMPLDLSGFELLEGRILGGYGADSFDLSGVGATIGILDVQLRDGNDRFVGGGEKDVVSGGYGDDYLEGGAGDDRLDGGMGADTAGYAGARGGVRVDLNLTGHQDTVSAGYDALSGIENVLGSAFADTLRGNFYANRLDGGSGDDVLYGLDGNDMLVGGAGRDGLDGGAGSDQLQGGAGDDQLFGNSGDDRLSGGDGADVLVGGSGRDLFVFEAFGLRDTIRDFSSYDDNIALSRSVFSSLTYTSSGTINAAHFVNGTQATTASQHLIYDRNTGNLFYDADGSGAGAQVLIANFESRPLVAASDFVIGG